MHRRGPQAPWHQAELQLIYVLKGWMKNEFEGHGEQMMSAGSCWLQPPGIKHTVLDYSADCEVLEIIVPADFRPRKPPEYCGARGPSQSSAMASHERLDCLKCPALCCRMAGYVRVSRDDMRRLAKHLDISVVDFEKRHIVEVTKKGEKRIKEGYKTCQFLDENHMCGVYEARPHDCRGYVCWNQPDETVYGYAVFLQTGVERLRKQEG